MLGIWHTHIFWRMGPPFPWTGHHLCPSVHSALIPCHTFSLMMFVGMQRICNTESRVLLWACSGFRNPKPRTDLGLIWRCQRLQFFACLLICHMFRFHIDLIYLIYAFMFDALRVRGDYELNPGRKTSWWYLVFFHFQFFYFLFENIDSQGVLICTTMTVLLVEKSEAFISCYSVGNRWHIKLKACKSFNFANTHY